MVTFAFSDVLKKKPAAHGYRSTLHPGFMQVLKRPIDRYMDVA